MSARISHSLLDPHIGPRLSSLYQWMPIPRWFPPEGIVACGHLSAIAGAIGLGLSTQFAWGGLLAAAGIIGNHIADCVDGKHARATGQCRNGGELLDHFTDPLSFSYWLIGLAVACGQLEWGLAAVTILMAMAVLTNIRAKLTDQFVLASFGPTEFKTLLASFGILLTVASFGWLGTILPIQLATVGLAALVVFGASLLPIQLYQAVKEVNRSGKQPDTSEWKQGDA